MRLKITAPQLFAAVSLLLILAVAIATSVTQSSFYENAIIGRDSAIMRDMVQALTISQHAEGHLSADDLEHYATAAAQARLDVSFRGLTHVLNEVRIKVFNLNGTIAWSDEPRLVGSSFTQNPQELARALRGEVRAILFDPRDSPGNPLDVLPQRPLIEYYVPFSFTEGDSPRAVEGVLALYRSPQDLNETIEEGRALLWTVTGVGGLILFGTLYSVFRSVYFGKRAAESRFTQLTAEHGRLMQLERLSAMGTMVSEIAHQLNNPLVGVINLTQLAEREIDNPQRVKALLADVRKAGADCRSFVQSMLALNKVARAEPQLTDLTRLVRDTVAFFQQSLGRQPHVTVRAPSEPVMIEADPVLIRNALFNLVHNAAQADPAGEVTVTLDLAQVSSGARGISVSVSDSGPGLTREVQSKLFTPFFTTRAGGTGLGLSIAKHIAVLHGGTLSAENRAEGGARFMMWLPA